jgi:hypothetical protein
LSPRRSLVAGFHFPATGTQTYVGKTRTLSGDVQAIPGGRFCPADLALNESSEPAFSHERSTIMLKRLVIAAGVVSLLSVPALAQQYVPSAGSGNLVQGPGGPPVTANTPAYIGQRNGEAYNYRHSYGAAHCRTVIRHVIRNGERVSVGRRICS